MALILQNIPRLRANGVSKLKSITSTIGLPYKYTIPIPEMYYNYEGFFNMRLILVLFSILILSAFSNSMFAQKVVKTDSVPKTHADSLKFKADSIALSKQKLKAKVEYEAADSISFDFKDKKAFLYKDGSIKYQKMGIKAASIEIDFDKSITYSKGVADSTGKMIGEPIFNEGDEEFSTKILDYNYETKKGFYPGCNHKRGGGLYPW